MAFFKSKNSITTLSLMQGIINKSEKYLDCDINQCKDPNIISNLFGDIFFCESSYFITIEDYFIFSNSEASLQYVIENYKASNTLKNSNQFRSYKTYLSPKSNILFYINIGKHFKDLTNQLHNKYQNNISFVEDSLKNLTSFSTQISVKNNLLLNNISIFYDEDFQEYIKEEWFTQLDTSIYIAPQFVKNHFTKEEMILVQTNSNMLYAINSKGEIVWQKMIDSKIIGKISSIDVYKNNKYQCLFNTNNSIHIIDRNGDYVTGFPKILPHETSQSHSLFDYENSKRYRIIIIGKDNKIYNFDSKGKKVRGWKHKRNDEDIINSAKHFRINKKDYILQETGNSNSKLLAINGTERVTFNSSFFEFNNNNIQIDNNGTLHAITNEGKLWRANLEGIATEIIIPYMTNNSLLTIGYIKGEKHLIFSNENTVFALDNDFNTIYSHNFKNKIAKIYFQNKYLIVQTTKEFTLIEDGELLKGFPIKTDGQFNISDINNNGRLDILNCQSGSLYRYELVD